MRNHVREDHAGLSALSGSGPKLLRMAAWAGAVVAILAVAVPVAAQDGAQAPAFTAKVLDTSAGYQRLTVPLNRSVIVETSVEAARVDVVASEVVDVKPVSPTQLLVTGQSYGTTNIILWDAANQQYVFEVTVELDVAALREAANAIDPQSAVEARAVRGNIVLTGTVSGIEQADRIVALAGLFIPTGADGEAVVQNHLTVAGEQQVRLHTIVAEVSRQRMRELGINGFLAGDNFKDAFLVNQIGGIQPIDIGAAADALVTQNIPFLTGGAGIPLSTTSTLSLGFPRVQLQAFIKAMADNSLLKVLAEPNLVALSGETASFLVGGEFPVPVPQGNQQVTIEFREFGVRLSFTPLVRAHQQVRLTVRPEVSELDFSSAVPFEGFAVPGLKSRAAQTTIEVGSGQTFIIAGLLNEEMSGRATRIPGLGDLPVLGALFRSVDFRRKLSELVILVTPEIVAPLDPQQVPPLPGHDIRSPNDLDMYLNGRIQAPATAEAAPPLAPPSAAASGNPENLSIHGPWGQEDG
ncbi:MAG: type II and III secretion system protein family protein [Phycisphaerae bacterium]